MRRVFRQLVPPAGAVALLLATWHAVVVGFAVDPQVLPLPADVLRALKTGLIDGTLHPHIWYTVRATLIGILIGTTIGVVSGALVGESAVARAFLYPVVIALQSIPLVAVAPLLIVWLGMGIESKIFLVAQFCFFPVFANTVVGILSTKQELVDLFRTFSASRWRILAQVKLPCAVHHIFSGLQTAVVLSLIGCVVAEFVASSAGIGYYIKALSLQLDVAMMFAAILTLAMLGSLAGMGVAAVYRRLAFWADGFEQPVEGANLT